MNDEFLYQYQPEIRVGFEQTLCSRLRSIEHRHHRNRQISITVLVLAVLFSSSLLIPQIRAQVQWLVREIGGVTFVETMNPRENWETIIQVYTTPTPSPQVLDGEYLADNQTIPMLSYSWVERTFPDAHIENFLPSWVPDDFKMQDAFNIDVNRSHIVIFWQKGEATSYTLPPWFSLGIWVDLNIPFVVSPENVQEVQIGEQTAALWVVEGVHTSAEDQANVYALAWQHNDLYYTLNWRETDLTFVEIYHIAESIPDVPLPIEPEILGELLRQIIITE